MSDEHERPAALEQKVDHLLARVEHAIKLMVDLNERMTYRERVLVGWKEIAAYLGVFPNTAMAWAKEDFDPLPIEHDHQGHVVARATALDAYKVRRARRMSIVRSENAVKAQATRTGKATEDADEEPSR